MEFEIKCHLGYEVSGPASFLFNVAVAQNSFQRIITEHFDLAGADSRQEMVIGGQRYHRVTAQSGSVELVYEVHPPDFHAYIEAFLGGALDPIRSDAPCSTVELRAYWTGSRCCGHVVRDHLRRRNDE